jgi:TonB family protein
MPSKKGLLVILFILSMITSLLGAEPQEIIPPKLIRYVKAKYPKEAQKLGISGEVIAEIDIDAKGKVTMVRIIKKAGYGFDQAALEAMKNFKFTPAFYRGKPISSRILYKYKFILKKVKKTSPLPKPTITERLKVALVKPKETKYKTVVRAEIIKTEPTKHVIEREEFSCIAGTGRDPLKVIQTFPGVGRMQFGDARLIVRGSKPEDTKIFLRGLEVPMLYHFGGLTSVFNADILERIDFIPGNFPVRYGNAIGGIVEVEPRSPKRDRLHGYVDLDFLDGGILLEGPLGEKTGFAIAFRRSWIEAILPFFMPEELNFVILPRYYDYQAILDINLKKKGEVRTLVYGSDDALEFVMRGADAPEPAMKGGAKVNLYFHKAQTSWKHIFSPKSQNIFSPFLGFSLERFKLGTDMVDVDVKIFQTGFRDEFTFTPSPLLSILIGIDALGVYYDARARVFGLPPKEGIFPTTHTDKEVSEVEATEWDGGIALYLQTKHSPFEELKLIPGVRVAYYGPLKEVGIDPRLNLRYSLFEGITLKGGIGYHKQMPQPQEWIKGLGNPELITESAIHYSLGVEIRPLKRVFFDFQFFLKELQDLTVISQRKVMREGKLVREKYSNEGIGKIYGGEFLIRHEPSKYFFGWISYTLSKSKRRDKPYKPWRLFDFDQTHILTLVANVKFLKTWQIGARFRLTTGNPYTPIINSYYNSDYDFYTPIPGEYNSERLPLFHQLDLRVLKRFEFKIWMLEAYLEVTNIYNNTNPEGINYNYDYTEKIYTRGIPIFPSLGIKGSF